LRRALAIVLGIHCGHRDAHRETDRLSRAGEEMHRERLAQFLRRAMRAVRRRLGENDQECGPGGPGEPIPFADARLGARNECS
jgi:hypothetical protein